MDSYRWIRMAVAYVFITSGMMKFVIPQLAQTFIELNLPFPTQLMFVVAIVEIIGGILLLANKSVKLAVMPLIGIMVAAIILTKLPLLQTGFMPFAFQARLDIVMLILLFILFFQDEQMTEKKLATSNNE